MQAAPAKPSIFALTSAQQRPFMPQLLQAPANWHALHCQFFDSPIGPLRLGATDAGLSFINFPNQTPAEGTESGSQSSHPHLEAAKRQLAEYFAGVRTHFDVPLAPKGSAFQRQVWQALTSIAYGKTSSYGALAQGIGRPTASRAVGAANARNPLPIVVPCHRVVGANGALTGFSGGLERKIFLLELERNNASQ